MTFRIMQRLTSAEHSWLKDENHLDSAIRKTEILLLTEGAGMTGDGIEDVIGTYAEMTRDFRDVVRRVKECGIQYSLTASLNGEVLDVLWVSLYDEGEHGSLAALEVNSRDLASDTAYHLNAVRFLLTPLKILVRGVPKYLVEPGASTRRWVRTRLGVASARQYREVVLAGDLGRWLMDREEQKRERVLEKLKSVRGKLDKLRERQQKLARARDQYRKEAQGADAARAMAAIEASMKSGDLARAKTNLDEWIRKAKDFENVMMEHRLNELDFRNQLIENGITPRKRQPPMAGW